MYVIELGVMRRECIAVRGTWFFGLNSRHLSRDHAGKVLIVACDIDADIRGHKCIVVIDRQAAAAGWRGALNSSSRNQTARDSEEERSDGRGVHLEQYGYE